MQNNKKLGTRSRDKVDCKIVVFGCFRKARSAVSVILECEACEPHAPTGRVRRENDSRFPLAVFTLATDLSFKYGLLLMFAKNTAVLQSKDRVRGSVG